MGSAPTDYRAMGRIDVEQVVIIGGGQAAASAARTLREQGFEGGVTILSEEAYYPYERPPLSKAVLQGAADANSTCLLGEEAARSQNINVRLGQRAEAIDRDRKVVKLASGESLPYDRLLITTGSRARTLDGAFAGRSNVFYLRSLDDAAALKAAMAPGKHLLSIGAGWIGLEVAATARKMGMQATVVELADRLCGRSLPADVGALLAEVHREQGTVVHLNTAIESVGGRDRIETVTLSNGQTLAVDLVVVGIGAVANDALGRDAGLETANGIVVDEFLRTSDPNIFAAGDVAAMRIGEGRPARMESWANAQDQAAAAARNILGKEMPYAVNTWFWSDQYDLNIQMIGNIQPEGGSVLVRKGEGKAFTRFSVADGRLVGAICFGAPRDMAIIRRLMSKGYVVTDDALATAPELRKLL